jgi:outer membrane protein
MQSINNLTLTVKRGLMSLAIVASGITSSAMAAEQQDFISTPVYKSLSNDNIWAVYQRSKAFDADYLRALQVHMAAREGETQARGRLYPEISLFAEEVQTEQDIKASDIDVFGSGSSDFDTTRYGLNLSQPIFDWERFQRFGQAKRETALADVDMLQASQDLMISVAERYLTVLAAQDNLEFSRREEKAVIEQENIAKARLKGGTGREADYLEALARAASVYADRLVAENQLDDAIEGLREISGAGTDSYAQLSDGLEPESPQPNNLTDWVSRSMEGNLAVQKQRYAMIVAQYEVDRQKGGHYPSVNFFGRFNNEEQGGSLFGGSSEVDTTEFGIRIDMPLFSGGGVRSKVREAAYRYEAEMETLHKEMRMTGRETRAAFLDVRTAMAQIDSLNKGVEAQQKVVVTKRKGYPRLYTSREVLDSERDLYSAKRDAAKATYDYLLSGLKLKASIGSLNEADLEKLNGLFSQTSSNI